jgi:hypothetical protein
MDGERLIERDTPEPARASKSGVSERPPQARTPASPVARPAGLNVSGMPNGPSVLSAAKDQADPSAPARCRIGTIVLRKSFELFRRVATIFKERDGDDIGC